MNELMSQLWTPELQIAFTLVIILLVGLYVLSIVWVVRDAYLRGTIWYVWAIVALIPLAGVIAYCLLRPPLLQIDRDEQELEIALKQRELLKYGECGACGYPVESDYVLCPSCHQRLKNLCPQCNHALDPSWSVCPYCATPAPQQRRAARAAAQQSATKQPATAQQQPAAKQQIAAASKQQGATKQQPATKQQGATKQQPVTKQQAATKQQKATTKQQHAAAESDSDQTAQRRTPQRRTETASAAHTRSAASSTQRKPKETK